MKLKSRHVPTFLMAEGFGENYECVDVSCLSQRIITC